MNVSLDEYRLGGLRWIVLRGQDREVFRTLGEHTRDEIAALMQTCALLTLVLDGLPTVTAFWYPGFLPSNAFAVTGNGLVLSIDHLPVASPGHGAARHFVARGLQRSARTVDEAVDYLRTHRSAGGFAYTIGDRTGRIVSVEAAAGRLALVEVGPGSGPLLWHTNHGRYLPGSEPSPDGNSVARGEALGALPIPAEDPDPAWFLHILAGASLPDGVRCDPAPGRSATTLCTFIADLTAAEAVIAARDDQPIAIPLPDLAEGNPHRQRQLVPSQVRSASTGSGDRAWRPDPADPMFHRAGHSRPDVPPSRS